MTSPEIRHPNCRPDDGIAHAVLISAQLLALNAALGAAGAGETGSLLSHLARDLRLQVTAPKRSRARVAGRH